ncbi:NAD-dependent epimerase/dehydratase family protein [Paenibacillus sp. FSL R7-0345]|uniref:NAD-dependent epimerase/dehydratase family protein n=1 Tax=Paenibacillus sp. FSL R7-0345 TaxID=2954535 RepID=UPI00315A8861
MKILVTGAAGFIGSHIVDSLVAQNHQVVGVDNFSTGAHENVNAYSKIYDMDINSEEVSTVFSYERPEVIIHHAAQIDVGSSMKNPLNDQHINIRGTLNILENMKKFGGKKIIYASSAAVYGTPKYLPVNEAHPIEPLSFYGISKYTPENYIKIYSEECGFKYTIFRYSNVYGPRQSAIGEAGVISIFINRLANKQAPIIHGDGEQYRDFIYVSDIVNANVKALELGDGEILNLSMCETSTINYLLSLLKRNMSSDILPIFDQERVGDIRESCLDNSKAKKILGWSPEYSLEDGIGDLCKYYKEKEEKLIFNLEAEI